jgi:hypothetical protein
MALHSALTDPELHEPKGASTAVVNTVYVADGAASGDWYKIYTQGFEDYQNTGGAQSPAAATFTDLTNNGLGANTLTTYTLPSVTGGLWDTATNSLDFTELTLGDTVDIRFDMSVTTAAANEEVVVVFDLAHGTGSEYQLVAAQRSYKTAGTYDLGGMLSIYMGNTATLNNPGKIAIKFGGASCSVTVDGWFIRVIPRNPILGA